ncbi:MAG TPA: hypothetical protein VIT62_08895 [Lysobacter sp.]
MSEQAFANALAEYVRGTGATVEMAAALAAPLLGRDPTIRDVQAAKKARPDVFPPDIEYRRLTR